MKTIIIVACFLLIPAYAFANGIFIDGKWEDGFDTLWSGSSGNPPPGDWSSGTRSLFDGLKYSEIVTDANHPGGSGQAGFRRWIGDGVNRDTGGPFLYFGAQQKELWIRYYIRYEEGFTWDGGRPNYDKQMRVWMHSHGGNPNVIAHLSWSKRFGAVVEYALKTGSFSEDHGWTMTPYWTDDGTNSHGRWNCVEMHIKVESAAYANDGILRVWLNGELVVENIEMGFINPDASTNSTTEELLAGWSHLHFCNQRSPDNENGPLGRNHATVDYDDIVIYNQTPPNTDAHGNPFIGPLPPAPPWGLSIDVQ